MGKTTLIPPTVLLLARKISKTQSNPPSSRGINSTNSSVRSNSNHQQCSHHLINVITSRVKSPTNSCFLCNRRVENEIIPYLPMNISLPFCLSLIARPITRLLAGLCLVHSANFTVAPLVRKPQGFLLLFFIKELFP